MAVADLKIDLFPQADRVLRQYDEENGLSIHAFYYDLAGEEDAQDFQIDITTREKFQLDAWQLNQPVIRNVPRADGLLELRSVRR